MNSLNSILLEGNLTRPPEHRSTPKGTPICSFTVASNRYFQAGNDKQKEVSFFDVEAWSSLAKQCGEGLEKGRGVRIVGRLKQDRWLDTDGRNRSHIKIVAEHVEIKPVFSKPKDHAAHSQDPEESDTSYNEEIDEEAIV